MKKINFYKIIFGNESKAMNAILFSALIGTFLIFSLYYRFDTSFPLVFYEVKTISTYLPIVMIVMFNIVMSDKIINKFEKSELYDYYVIYATDLNNSEFFLFKEQFKNISIYLVSFTVINICFYSSIEFIYSITFDTLNIFLFFYLNLLILRYRLPSQIYILISIIESSLITSSVSGFSFNFIYEISKIIIIVILSILVHMHLQKKIYMKNEFF